MSILRITNLDTLQSYSLPEPEPDTVLGDLTTIFIDSGCAVLSQPFRHSITVFAPKPEVGTWRIEVQESNS